jgi:hypothetical protein
LVKTLEAEENNSIAACPWMHLEMKNSKWILVPTTSSTTVKDDLKAWLQGNYLPIHALLWPRKLLEAIGGWDESLRANQDGDLMFRALLFGAKIIRTEGGTAYYRIYGQATNSVSTVKNYAAWNSRLRVLEKLEMGLIESGTIKIYALALAQAYHGLAIAAFNTEESIARQASKRAKELGGVDSITGTFAHRIGCFVLGVEGKLRLAKYLDEFGILGIWRRLINFRVN